MQSCSHTSMHMPIFFNRPFLFRTFSLTVNQMHVAIFSESVFHVGNLLYPSDILLSVFLCVVLCLLAPCWSPGHSNIKVKNSQHAHMHMRMPMHQPCVQSCLDTGHTWMLEVRLVHAAVAHLLHKRGGEGGKEGWGVRQGLRATESTGIPFAQPGIPVCRRHHAQLGSLHCQA